MVNTEINTPSKALARNRAEEIGKDVWECFVIPPFFNRLDLHVARKPRVIIGGRGCGKTMLLRYLSYHSTFSKNRKDIPADAIEHIGLYWRADTQFASMMHTQGLPDETWRSAFNHLVALIVGAEFLNSLDVIANSGVTSIHLNDLENLDFSELHEYGWNSCGKYSDIQAEFRKKLREFETWVSNIKKLEAPIFTPAIPFLMQIIEICKTQIPQFSPANFFVYIDEYENLLEYQQQIVNTYLKHSEMPLIFNIAAKKNGHATKKTLGEEEIIDPDDYRTHDIESYIDEQGIFEVFAGEVFLLTLSLNGVTVPIKSDDLRDLHKLEDRQKPAYRKIVLDEVKRILPTMSHKQLAQEVFENGAMMRILEKRVEAALKYKKIKTQTSDFIISELPEASIITPALIYRGVNVERITKELKQLQLGEDNAFSGKTDWIANNFIGSLLSLYESSPRVCPFFAGYISFIHLSKGNLRHFMELCHQSLSDIEKFDEIMVNGVDVQTQAKAAQQTSIAFLNQVRSFGRHGNRLHAFVLGIGSVFALSHKRPTQSEPERSHFSIVGDTSKLGDDDRNFLEEAVKWSVLFEERETKTKNVDAAVNMEYVLNPIYAPYFNITYRKKRRLELPVEDFLTLEKGGYNEVNALLARYKKSWSVNIEESVPNLFSQLEGDL